MENILWQEHLAQWKNFLLIHLDLIESERIKIENQIKIARSNRITERQLEEIRGDYIKIERQLKTIEQVRSSAVLNPRLLIEFIQPSNKKKMRLISKTNFILPLNESQKEAVTQALSDNLLTLIQGPPGTGKTQVITEICLQLFQKNKNIRILVCSETHIAVNNLISRIADYNDDIRIIRIRDREHNSQIDDYSPAVIIEEYLKWLENNIDDKETIKLLSHCFSDTTNKSLEKSLSLSANVVGMTCNRAGAYNFESTTEMFDIVIIDEVCKATLPEILMPMTIAKNAVLVGDPKQLPPVFCSEEIEIIKNIDKCNLQKYMYIDNLFGKSPNIVILDTQYRMVNEIGTLISDIFYVNEKLKNGRDESSPECITWANYIPSKQWPVPSDGKTGDIKIFNTDECKIIGNILSLLNETEPINTSIAIIAPYRHQIIELRKQNYSEKTRNLQINIDTVDGFQGKESDILIFSLTRTNGTFRFLADPRRLNVALSRARNKIIIVGYLEYAIKNILLKTIANKYCKIEEHSLT